MQASVGGGDGNGKERASRKEEMKYHVEMNEYANEQEKRKGRWRRRVLVMVGGEGRRRKRKRRTDVQEARVQKKRASRKEQVRRRKGSIFVETII